MLKIKRTVSDCYLNWSFFEMFIEPSVEYATKCIVKGLTVKARPFLHLTLVHMVVQSNLNFCKLDPMLFISNHPEEWESEKLMLKKGIACAYVYNYDFPNPFQAFP